MLRRLFTILSALSLLLAVGALLLWFRSVHNVDWIFWERNTAGQDFHGITLRTCRGGFEVEDYRLHCNHPQAIGAARDGFTFGSGGEEAQFIPPNKTPALTQETEGMHFSPFGWPYLKEPTFWEWPGFETYNETKADAMYVNEWRGAVVPYWMVLAAAGVAPVGWLVWRMLRRWCGSLRTGRGYDVSV